MNVHAPLTGWLTDKMVVEAGVPVPQDELIHPRAEPELVFVMGAPLEGPGVTAATAMEAVDKVYGGLEIIDSRYANFRFRLPDVVADNASGAGFTLGGQGISPAGLDLRLTGCVFERNGRLVATAAGAAVLGHPAASVAWLVRALAARGQGLLAGQVVLSGSMTEAVAVTPGDCVTARFDRLGTVELPCT